MRKKRVRIISILFVVLSLIISTSIFSAEGTIVKKVGEKKVSEVIVSNPSSLLHTKEQILSSLDDQIKELMKKKEEIEALKVKMATRKGDINVKNLENLKIALVLSGGGSKGAAHVGVLKVLEKYKVPIDIVVGTSIGSIVGGMYSVGYTPEEIEKTILNLNVGELATNSSERKLQGAEERFSQTKYPMSLKIKDDYTPSIPMGVIDGEKIYLQLKEIFARAKDEKNFDTLPRRYRAIATELQTGNQEIIDHGDMALATFRSMAIPTFLKPVESEGKFYVDGGLVNNFPIDVAVDMGADIIIAVDITANSTVINKNSDVFDIVDKISSYTGDRNTTAHKKLADILIVPDIKDHGTVDFTNLEELIEKGRQSAEQVSSTLMNFSNEVKYSEIKAKTEPFSNKNQGVVINEIELKGNKVLTLEKVNELRPRTKRAGLSTKDLETWTKGIDALGYVSRAFYEIQGDKIIFNIEERENVDAHFGINYSTYGGAAIRTGLTLQQIGLSNKLYELNLTFSKYPEVYLKNDNYFSVGDYKLVGGAEFGYKSRPLSIWKNGKDLSTLKSEDFYATLSVGSTFTRYAITGLNLTFKNNKITYNEGSEDYEMLEKDKPYFEQSVFLTIDTLDKVSFPSEGYRIYAEGFHGNKINSAETGVDYLGYIANAEYHQPINKKLSLGIGGVATNISGDNIPLSEFSSLGGVRDEIGRRRMVPFYGLSSMEKYLDEAYVASASFKYNLKGNFNLIGKYNYAWINRTLNEFLEGEQRFGGYGAGLGWDSVFGPVELILSNNVEGTGVLYQVYIGYEF